MKVNDKMAHYDRKSRHLRKVVNNGPVADKKIKSNLL